MGGIDRGGRFLRLALLLVLQLQFGCLEVEGLKCHVCSDADSPDCRKGGEWLSSNPTTIQECGKNSEGKSAAYGCLVLLLEFRDPQGDEETKKTIIFRDCLYPAYLKCHPYWSFLTDLNRPGIIYNFEAQTTPGLRSYMEFVNVGRLSLGLEPVPYQHIPKQGWGRKNVQLNIQNGIMTNSWPITKVFPSIVAGRSGFLSAGGIAGIGPKPRQKCSPCLDSSSRYCQGVNEGLGSGALPTCYTLGGTGVTRNANGCKVFWQKSINQRRRPITSTIVMECLYPSLVNCYYIQCTNVIGESIDAVLKY